MHSPLAPDQTQRFCTNAIAPVLQGDSALFTQRHEPVQVAMHSPKPDLRARRASGVKRPSRFRTQNGAIECQGCVRADLPPLRCCAGVAGRQGHFGPLGGM